LQNTSKVLLGAVKGLQHNSRHGCREVWEARPMQKPKLIQDQYISFGIVWNIAANAILLVKKVFSIFSTFSNCNSILFYTYYILALVSAL